MHGLKGASEETGENISLDALGPVIACRHLLSRGSLDCASVGAESSSFACGGSGRPFSCHRQAMSTPEKTRQMPEATNGALYVVHLTTRTSAKRPAPQATNPFT